MLKPRIIPCLLVKNGGLVKTTQFQNPKYVGDPINAVKIFNEKEVDELIVLDIDATAQNREPNYEMINNLAAECRMPLCYGGGVKKLEQVEKIISLGVEKVAFGSSAVDQPELIKEAARNVGKQSVVVVMDIKKEDSGEVYELKTLNGTRSTALSPIDFARKVEKLNAGEIVINSIDRDGTMTGYDVDLARAVWESVNLPLTFIGGAGSLKDIEDMIRLFGQIGVAAGSLFVFKGPYRAVLINYPNRHEKDTLIKQALSMS